MVKKATSGEEYKILKQTSTPKKIAKILILVWTVCVIAPVMYVCLTQAVLLKDFAVVKGVNMLNGLLQSQYTNLTNNVIQKVDIQKYTSQIKVPEIKLDQVTETTEKVAKASGALAKLGVKNADKIEDSTKALQKKLDKANAQLQTSIEQIQKTLQADIQTALKKELTGLADTQVQKQLGISSSAYARLVKGDFGFKTQTEREATTMIYQELAQAKKGLLTSALSYLDCYFNWVKWIVTILVLVVLLVPVVLVWWIAKKLSANFTQCPYCGKVFLSKAAKFNLLKLFK